MTCSDGRKSIHASIAWGVVLAMTGRNGGKALYGETAWVALWGIRSPALKYQRGEHWKGNESFTGKSGTNFYKFGWAFKTQSLLYKLSVIQYFVTETLMEVCHGHCHKQYQNKMLARKTYLLGFCGVFYDWNTRGGGETFFGIWLMSEYNSTDDTCSPF